MNLARISLLAGMGLRSPVLTSAALKWPWAVNNYTGCKIVRYNHRKSVYKSDGAKKLRFYVIIKYVQYLKNFGELIEKKFPGPVRIYRLFMNGIREFITDTKEYLSIVRLLNTPGKNFQCLLRREMELYEQMPKDMKKVAPIIVIAALPFVPYILLPIIYMFPHHFLSSHFWSLQQKADFQILNLKSRLAHNRPIFRHLQSQLEFLRTHNLQQPWKHVIGKIGSGSHPTVNEIVICKELFMTEPYHLLYLSRNHVVHLLKLHEMSVGWFFRRSRLAERAFFLREMDKAIMREGGVHNMPNDALKKACFIRGLNPTNMKNEEMIKWLTDWIQLSCHIDKNSYSLLLHAPILLGYNASSNWMLIYK